ncbi:MAG: HAD-IC family P-type ATPase, partial [Hespellia sp.]|nr:HAD-IC family P-type ATPase [Hespellia sp.]
MTKGTQKKLIELGVGTILYAYAIFATGHWELRQWQSLVLFLLSYIVITASTLQDMGRNFKKFKFFDENLLMLLATVGAFLVGKNAESVAVMLFFQCGKFLEAIALQRSRKSIEKLMDIRPDHANRKVDGEEVMVDPSELKIGDIIIIKSGERVPVDAVITSGRSTIDSQAITGESMPQEVEPGGIIYSGSINVTGVLEARVKKLYGESTVSKILHLVKNASSRKARTENFVGKFTKFYTPIVTVCAFAIMIIPPYTFAEGDLHTWVYRGLIFLVTACPCGLVTSVPLAFFGGIGAASRQGVVIKGSNYLEALAAADTFVFDKTGTLTKGEFNIGKIHPVGMSEDELLELAALGESYSNHPIAVSLRDSYGKPLDKERVERVEEFTGFGVLADIEGKKVYIGNAK